MASSVELRLISHRKLLGEFSVKNSFPWQMKWCSRSGWGDAVHEGRHPCSPGGD
ncbi:hypothetical protein HPP92_006160 [Vanilla planifolia]|uniref:Uncharacterized protein n=1 Tax=Vanilla planifolia TaxID=51239 RepID=A0A835RKC5_VANPL|nr:hypothetical protein HPP92_006452 [Vanilla planifolia]KAG0495166.1 hypothetical protein HPP92_006160 [Vanilla planifolia]